MDEKDDFTVRDRRSSASDTGETPPGAEARQRRQDPGPVQDLDFSAFVISLATTAQMSLGAIPHPETNQTARNFPAAKQMIDILSMLQAKTKGNLTEAEAALLEQVLFNLRMHYVRTVEGQNKSGG